VGKGIEGDANEKSTFEALRKRTVQSGIAHEYEDWNPKHFMLGDLSRCGELGYSEEP